MNRLPVATIIRRRERGLTCADHNSVGAVLRCRICGPRFWEAQRALELMLRNPNAPAVARGAGCVGEGELNYSRRSYHEGRPLTR